MKILVATHKEKVFINNEIIHGIQVGAANADYVIDSSYYMDNNGENISAKNQQYNELTALYWMWKNMRNENILGLVHYRRYFNFFFNRWFKTIRQIEVSAEDGLVKQNNEKAEKIESLVKKWLEAYDIIAPVPFKYGRFKSLKDDYSYHHRQSDWDATMQIIREMYPEYIQSVVKYLENDNVIYWANLFVARYSFVDKYCEWLFPVFFELEKRITVSNDPYQRRVYGFLSERLFTLYIYHNKISVKEIPTLLITEMFEKYKPVAGGGSLSNE